MKYHKTLVLRVLLNPILLGVLLLRKLPLSWLFSFRMDVDGIERPYYAYGLYQAALEAKALGISRISAYEFGVAGGIGLIILEQLSIEITKLTGVMIDIYGFDIAIGLPEPADYRDLPYIWQKGFFSMDVEALKKRLLHTTTLVIGDVKKTVPSFIKTSVAPIGFVAIDTDYYSSAKSVLKLFDTKDANMLPRIFCYLDDIIGTDEEILCEYVGELLAISEFNKTHPNKKIAKIHGMFHKRAIKSTWSDMIYVMHNFKHKQYNTYIYPSSDRQAIIAQSDQ